jgi:ArsR family transcriptional regulator, arsenate/arsenite/antimonite-responsive transcriptional repressor
MKTNYTNALPSEWKPMSDIFTALGDEHRQRMLMLFEPDERLTAGQISDASTLARTTVSHHLKILRQAKVLLSEKKGKEVWFWINKPLLEETFGNILNYLQGNGND